MTSTADSSSALITEAGHGDRAPGDASHPEHGHGEEQAEAALRNQLSD
jgi:hypothetical protein